MKDNDDEVWLIAEVWSSNVSHVTVLSLLVTIRYNAVLAMTATTYREVRQKEAKNISIPTTHLFSRKKWKTLLNQ